MFYTVSCVTRYIIKMNLLKWRTIKWVGGKEENKEGRKPDFKNRTQNILFWLNFYGLNE